MLGLARRSGVKYAAQLVNRLPSAAIGGKSPIEVCLGKAVNDYDSLCVFGCPAYYHVTESKLDPRAKKFAWAINRV
jgi:hypothetical protein